MAAWPPTPVTTIPSSGAGWPARVEVGPVTLIGPTAENQQPDVLDARTETLRKILNTLIGMNNVIRDFFLDRDGDDAAIAGSTQGPAFMRGDFDVGGFQIVSLSDATALTDAVTVQQLEVVQFSAEDDVEQVLQTRIVFQDGSVALIATLDMDGNRIIALDTALVSTDAHRRDYADGQVTALDAILLKRVGTPPMTGDLNLDGVLPADPGFKLTNLADPISNGDIVNLRFLNAQLAITGSEDVPIAALLPFAGPAAQIPANFLLCDGREVSRFTYQGLFNIIGIAYGPPSSGSVFKLPDLRGRAAGGIDNMGGQAAGRLSGFNALGTKLGAERHQLSIGEMAVHTHPYDDIYYAGGGAGVEQGDTGASDADNQFASTVRLTQNEGSGVAHNNMQPSQAFNWIIRF